MINPASFFIPPHSAYTPQVPHLFSSSLAENILLGLHEEHTDIQQAIQLAVLAPEIANLENGLQTIIGTRGVKLSGGQVQRTATARMLIRDSEFLVFDDILSALDVETEHRLLKTASPTASTYLSSRLASQNRPTACRSYHRPQSRPHRSN